MHLLALNPYAAGSHAAFFDGWRARSRHDWTLVELAGWNWKWRMRAAAVEMGARVEKLIASGQSWDAVVCTDMMNAAEWQGLAPPSIRDLPLVVYFHENQAGYPMSPERGADPRDVHFLLTNMVTALAANEAWFNSAYNLRTLTEGLAATLAAIPEGARAGLTERVASRARVEPPGIDDALFDLDRAHRPPGPLRILWAARWEFDKRPGVFAAALEMLAERGVEFVADVVGASDHAAESDHAPGATPFERLRARFPDRIGRFGRVDSREDFMKTLAEADVVVSTASHEFFGVAVVEAVAAGAMAAVPHALAYPEVLGEGWAAYHDGTPDGVCAALEGLARRLAERGSVWPGDSGAGRMRAERYRWSVRGAAMDAALERLGSAARGAGA